MVNFTATIPGQGGPGGDYEYGGGDFIFFSGTGASGEGYGANSINVPAAWLIVNGHDIARYSGSHGVHELADMVTRYPDLGAAPANGNVLITDTGSQTSCASKTINSLVVQAATPQASTLTGTLNIMNNGSGQTPFDANGGIVVAGSGDFMLNGGYTINGGTITSGVSGTNSELFVWIDSATTTINSVIADIGGGATTMLSKAVPARWSWAGPIPSATAPSSTKACCNLATPLPCKTAPIWRCGQSGVFQRHRHFFLRWNRRRSGGQLQPQPGRRERCADCLAGGQ